MDNLSNIMAIIGTLVILYKALVTTPGEARSSISDTMHNYEESLALMSERALKLEKKVAELELLILEKDKRIEALEQKCRQFEKFEKTTIKSSTINKRKEQ